MKIMEEWIIRMGNVRYKNVVRLFGYCYNKDFVYFLYDYSFYGILVNKIVLKWDWVFKYKIVMDIVRGFCFFYYDCNSLIFYVDLRLSNIVFDDSMEF